MYTDGVMLHSHMAPCRQFNQLHPEGDHIVLRISDNGIGLPAGVDIKIRNSLGFDLMHGLTKQLNSSLVIESNDGVHVIVRFIPLSK